MAQAVEQFRSGAREWLAANAPPPEPDATEEERVRTAKQFQKALHEAGFAGITWPAEFGGMGLSAAE